MRSRTHKPKKQRKEEKKRKNEFTIFMLRELFSLLRIGIEIVYFSIKACVVVIPENPHQRTESTLWYRNEMRCENSC